MEEMQEEKKKKEKLSNLIQSEQTPSFQHSQEGATNKWRIPFKQCFRGG